MKIAASKMLSFFLLKNSLEFNCLLLRFYHFFPMITSVADAEADTITDVPGPDSPKSNWALFCQIFGLVFLSEWGDKTQIATISLGTTHNPAGVAVGASFGISLCSAIAVIGGTVLSKRIKPQQMAILGAAVFLFFGIMGFYSDGLMIIWTSSVKILLFLQT